MPTKPEGPAQEPQVTMHRHLVKDERCDICDNRPATPAPSQPAGAREFAAIHLVSEAFSAFLEMTHGKPELDTRWMREAEELLCGGSPPAQQTAAKEAALKQTQADLIKFGQHGPYCPQGAECNCGYNDALWRFDGAPTNWRDRAVAAERERDSLRVENAALKAGKRDV